MSSGSYRDQSGTGAAPPKAVVLVSGGLDSATVLALAREAGFALYALSFDYGQRHRFELEAARAVCEAAGVVRQATVTLDMRPFGGSALTDEIAVPKDRSDADLSQGIPITYVPARNTIFLSVALGWAEVVGARDIFVGVNAVDYSGYPDCRPEYLRAFQKMANLATKAGVEMSAASGTEAFRIQAPLVTMSKAQIIAAGARLGVDYSLTHSCYDPDTTGAACGHCDSCTLRRRGFEQAGIPDPTRYQRSSS